MVALVPHGVNRGIGSQAPLSFDSLSQDAILSANARRHSSMVERSFRKAEVVGSTPTVGFLACRAMQFEFCHAKA